MLADERYAMDPGLPSDGRGDGAARAWAGDRDHPFGRGGKSRGDGKGRRRLEEAEEVLRAAGSPVVGLSVDMWTPTL